MTSPADKSSIVRFEQLKPEQIAEICLKCHTSQHVMLWRTSAHARAKVSCVQCHDPHSPTGKLMQGDISDTKTKMDGLGRSISAAELAENSAAPESKDREEASSRVTKLKAEKTLLETKLAGIETAYMRTNEPYVCYTCHKRVEIQGKLLSHHPIAEGKVKCSDCHNPHGGPNGMLKEETVNETCNRCHAEKAGPFTFEHPPVADDCTTCHKPHGSPQNNLLTQSQPFLCLRCHAGPHSRSKTLANPVRHDI